MKNLDLGRVARHHFLFSPLQLSQKDDSKVVLLAESS